jgi:3',5'-cyclic AMP phosphodiesterase CpdA
MRTIRALLAGFFLVILAAAPPVGRAQQTAAPAGPVSGGVFLVEPYLQLGDAPARGVTESLQLLWHTGDAAANWMVDYRLGDDQNWRRASAPAWRRVAVGAVPPHRIHQAVLAGLKAGNGFEYRVRREGETVFSAQARAPRPSGQPYRFVAFGDCGTSTAGQRQVAYQAYRARPDLVLITGDIVYNRGRVSEYREKFWPIYNAAVADPGAGAPLLRSTLFVAAPGNHDIASPDLNTFPDSLAYFYHWAQPMNGPALKAGDENTLALEGPAANQKAFLDAAGAAYPRMASFSFDFGNAHWTILDSNTYVDWTTTELRQWLERDLAAARDATWRFVAFHHPGFNSSRKHFSEQRMRRMAETFERGGVDVAFSGHVHNYQRTYPLRFVAGPARAKSKGEVDGRWTLDKAFDGKTTTRPQGVIYLVTGGGGAGLYDPEQQDEPESWQGFTHKFLSRVHSLTVADVDGATLTVRQLSASGEELDGFLVTK